MLEVLFWIVVGWAIWRWSCGRGCRPRRLEGGEGREQRRLPRTGPIGQRHAGRRPASGRQPAMQPAPDLPLTPERRAREAMRLYVDGRISVEEYEAELDRAYGLH